MDVVYTPCVLFVCCLIKSLHQHFNTRIKWKQRKSCSQNQTKNIVKISSSKIIKIFLSCSEWCETQRSAASRCLFWLLLNCGDGEPRETPSSIPPRRTDRWAEFIHHLEQGHMKVRGQGLSPAARSQRNESDQQGRMGRADSAPSPKQPRGQEHGGEWCQSDVITHQ